MRLLNNLIAILVIKILFVEVNIWHANATFVDFVPKFHFEKNLTEIFDCNESHKIIQLIPYLETYRSSSDDTSDTSLRWHFFRVKTRVNYKREWKCCEGYVQSGATCVPRCPPSCVKGTCKEPDICTCNNGYRMLNDSEGLCVPECTNGCINGICIAPEICSCNKGYWIAADRITCQPVCDAECERNHGYCSEPDVCTCRTGYRRGNIFRLFPTRFTCEPICDRPCTNGRCTAHNVCMCADGYEEHKYDPFTCKPKCHQPCVFGTCTAPSTCTCDSGYRMTNMNVCEPICSEPCVMGTCIAPESCSCNGGYGHRNGTSKYICEPICEIDCSNGTCTSRLCTCNKGFVYDEIERVCKPHCSKGCRENEECTSPDKCTCLKGYYSKTTYLRAFWTIYERPIVQSLCQPICNFTCLNGKCTAPNECTCDLGHYPSWIEFHHSLDNNIRICLNLPGPPCDAFSCGDNRTCHISGICICNDGYAKDTNGDCVPFCAQGCSNGTCTAPNSCSCHDGFAPRNESFCEPICERGCQNGDCIGPNRCVCHDNFVPSIYTEPECIPMCTRNCSGHGECIIDLDNDYRCECHFGWTGWNCDQSNMCVITMAYDHNNVNRITIHNDTNSTIMRAHESAPYCKCDKSFDNGTLCYMVQSDEGNTTFIGCLLNTDLPCYTTLRYNASVNVTKIVWPFVTIVILVIIGLTYLIYRNRQKKKLAIAGPSTTFVRESFATEFLLPDNEI